jgi:hypothetical protein
MRVDLFGLGNTFRAMSPFQQAVNLAHQAARQRLEAGGAPAPARKPAKPDPAPSAFILPGDVDPDEIAKAIEAKLREGGPVDEPVLQRRTGGRVVVPAAHLLRLGDGRFDKGRRFVQGLVNQIRVRRSRRFGR